MNEQKTVELQIKYIEMLGTTTKSLSFKSNIKSIEAFISTQGLKQ